MREFLKIFSKFGWLILLVFLFDFVFEGISLRILYVLIENILFGFAIICPLYFISRKKLFKYYLIVAYLIFSVSIYLETVYYYLFKTEFSSSAIFVTLDSNVSESKEFISFYLDASIILFTVFILILIVVTLVKIKNVAFVNFHNSWFNRSSVFSFFVAVLFFLKFSGLIVYNLPYLLIKSISEYRIESNKLGDYKVNKLGNFINVSKVLNDQEQEVYVVIIGESTSRSHLGIYDYYRKTTPGLSKRKEELLIYKDVISPHAYSVGSLTKILTLGNYENQDNISQGSILQLINKVGFETYWLSNQRPIGPYESMISKISLSANNHVFLTTTLAKNSKVLDGELLFEFNKVLKNNIKKKVIFIHLMGTHHNYENRYPKSFNIFNEDPITNFKSEESTMKINHYDNAILYNDFIISSVINQVDSIIKKSFVLYFSDHGEEMFDDINMAGHNEDIYSQKMFDIPFFIWQSKQYKQDKQLLFIEDRKYMIDDLFHSIADLLSIKALEVDSTRSIFNQYFKERKRIIKDTIDYDTFFK